MKKFNSSVLFIGLLLLTGTAKIFGQSIWVDTTFGTNGVISNPAAANYNEKMADMVLQPDGKILVAGSSGNASGQPTVIRFLATGVPDSTFGNGGYVFLGQAYDLESGAGSIKLLANGKILVSGNDDYPPGITTFVARLNTDGSVDTTFGTKGYSYFLQGKNLQTPKMVVLADGSIVTEYFNSSYRSTLVKTDSNGVADNSFGINDSLFVSQLNNVNTLTLDNNDNILVSGTVPDTAAIGVLRLLPNGQPDNTFGNNGLVLYDYYDSSSSSYYPGANPILSTLPNGNVLVTFNSSAQLVVATIRLLPNGMVDNTYGQHGITTSLGHTQVEAVAGMPNDELVLTGYFNYSSYTPVGEMAVLNNAGQLDTVFPGGYNSIIFVLDTSATNQYTTPHAVMLYPGNKLLVGGTVIPSLNTIGFARFDYAGFATTAVTEIAPVKRTQVYPNPANSYTMIASPFNEMKGASIKVYDLLGNMVLSTIVSNRSSAYRVDATTLTNGVYMVEIRSGNQVATSRLLVQH